MTSALAHFAALLAAASLLWAQEAKEPGLTAEQVLERSILATGGRAVMEKLTSTVAKGQMEVRPLDLKAAIEFYAQAPAKRLIVTKVEKAGELRQGCDGKAAWTHDPERGLRELEGAELAAELRTCAFNAELRWRELYPKVELAGKEKVGEREAHKVLMTPAAGKPITRYFDAATFLLIREVSTREVSDVPVEMRVDYSDYRDVDGVKMPFLITQRMPGAVVLVQFTEVKNNVALDDARFAKPAAK
jgi:hypothetical protein